MSGYEVDVSAGGKSYTLRVTPRVARTLNRRYQGLMNVFDRIRAWDIDVIVDVIATGSRLNLEGDQRDALWDSVWEMDEREEFLRGILGFVDKVMSGGRTATGDAAASGEGKP